MVPLPTLLLLSGVGTLLAYAVSPASSRRSVNRRAYIQPSQISASYDFVIAGGGLAGLVLAARLSDNSNTTVLVLEAGPSGDDVADRINTPSGTYYQSLLSAPPYDWVFSSIPQTNLNGRQLIQPRGRVLGGSTAVNGLYYVRPSQQEINAWHELIANFNSSAANTWTRDAFFAAIKNTETFTPPSTDIQSRASIKYSQGSRGSSGKLHTSYPGYAIPANNLWIPTLANAGIPSNADPDSGTNIGAFITSSTINPSNWTRSYSKSAYIDTLPPRQNLHILSNATVSRVIFAGNTDSAGNKIVNAVEYSSGRGTNVQTVTVNKDAILAGGPFGSPQILQLSGVGPPDVLTAANVTVQLQLPGVGQHLLDHLSVPVYLNVSVPTAGDIHANSSDSQTPQFNSFINDALAYINGSRLFDGEASFATFRSQIDSVYNVSQTTLVPSNYSEVVEGYKAIQLATTQIIYPTAGIVELIFSVNSPGVVAIQVALQQGLSQGSTYITSPSVYDAPTIDPAYLSHPADIVVLRQGIKLVRIIANSQPLGSNITAEILPGPQVQSDTDIETYIRTQAASEYHPAGTCAMLPQAKGGVVDAEFKVYGTKNLRVVDSSVFPISLCAHLMASTYALAETGAAVILNDWGIPSSESTGGGSTSTASTKAKGGSIGGSRLDWVSVFLLLGSVVVALSSA